MTKNKPLLYTCFNCHTVFSQRELFEEGADIKIRSLWVRGKERLFTAVLSPNCNYYGSWLENDKRINRMQRNYEMEKGWCITHCREMQ
jgi:hypothetical protein